MFSSTWLGPLWSLWHSIRQEREANRSKHTGFGAKGLGLNVAGHQL